jgi:hypothetical protein
MLFLATEAVAFHWSRLKRSISRQYEASLPDEMLIILEGSMATYEFLGGSWPL